MRRRGSPRPRSRELGLEVSPPAREWRGFSNGRLIAAVAAAGFDVLLSNDKNLIFQLNLATVRIAIVTLPNNRRRSLIARSEDIADTVRRTLPRQFAAMEADGRRTVRRLGATGEIIVEAMPPLAPFNP